MSLCNVSEAVSAAVQGPPQRSYAAVHGAAGAHNICTASHPQFAAPVAATSGFARWLSAMTAPSAILCDWCSPASPRARPSLGTPKPLHCMEHTSSHTHVRAFHTHHPTRWSKQPPRCCGHPDTLRTSLTCCRAQLCSHSATVDFSACRYASVMQSTSYRVALQLPCLCKSECMCVHSPAVQGSAAS